MKVFTRILIAIPVILLQLWWMILLAVVWDDIAELVNFLVAVYSFIFVLYIVTKRDEGSYKVLWLILILAFPLPGTFLYSCFGNQRSAKPIRKKLQRAEGEIKVYKDVCDEEIFDKVAVDNSRLAAILKRTQKETDFPLVRNECAGYFALGEEMHKVMLEKLRQAKKFIFAEYFIVENGIMWDSMVEIMEQKVLEGVEVYFMYDDVGSISTYSHKNVKDLKRKGVKCVSFNPITFISGTLNYRDHRKMLVIDGEIAFSGGVNLADEYINKKKKYGHWKDIGFYVTGAAAQVYSRMFVEFWNAFSKPKDQLEMQKYFPPVPKNISDSDDGFVLSYFDSPVKFQTFSNDLYIDLLYQSEHTAWFYTPYLMLGDHLLEAFVKAAERGVDVRIIMPGIPDKKIVYRMSRGYYRTLMEAGVKIYEYTPGFVHAKGCIIDGNIATVGTVNLDFRSLFLHFENNSVFFKSAMIKDIEADFLKTQSKSTLRTLADLKTGDLRWFIDGILRIFAPMC